MIPALLLLFTVLYSSCEKQVEAGPPPPPPDIPVVEVMQASMPLFDEFPGQTYGKLDISIRARVEGFLVSRHFEEGSRVTKGQLLYIIDPHVTPFLFRGH